MSQDSNNNGGETDPLAARRRREILMGIGTVGAMGVAGCLGGGGGGGTDTPDDSDGGSDGGSDGDGSTTEPDTVAMSDQTYRINVPTLSGASNAGYNFAGAAENVGPVDAMLFDWAIIANSQTGELAPHIFDDWSIDGTTMSITMREDFTWHNGDPVTADDVVTQLKMAALFGSARRVGSAGGIIDGYTAVQKTGEYSVEAEMTGELNPELAMTQVFAAGGPQNVLIFAKESKWGSFVEGLSDSTTEEEENSIKSEITNASWSIDNFTGNGPFKIKDYTNSAVLLEKHEGHPQSDNINFNEVEVRSFGDNKTQALASNSVDFEWGRFTQSSISQVPDKYKRIPYDRPGGPSVVPNHTHDIFGRSKVKQALAHITDNEQVANALGTSRGSAADPLDAGLSERNREEYLGGNVTEETLITFDSPERAATLLEEEGFTQEGGNWYKPNGERWSFDLRTWQHPVWSPICRNIASQWQDFGIDCSPAIGNTGTFFSEYPNGSYDIVVEWGRGSANPNPLIAFNRDMVGFGGGSQGYPEEVEAPPVGEPDGSLQTYNRDDLLSNAREATNQEAFTEAIRELAWVNNYTLPVIQNIHETQQYFFNTETFDWADEKKKHLWQVPRGNDSVMFRKGWAHAKQS